VTVLMLLGVLSVIVIPLVIVLFVAGGDGE